MGKELGLGYSADGEGSASKFAIRVRVDRPPSVRVSLLGRGEGDKELDGIYDEIEKRLKSLCNAEVVDNADVKIQLRRDKKNNVRPQVNLLRIQLLAAELKLNEREDLGEFCRVIYSFVQEGEFTLTVRAHDVSGAQFEAAVKTLLITLTLGASERPLEKASAL